MRIRGVEVTFGAVASVLVLAVGLWGMPWFGAEATLRAGEAGPIAALLADRPASAAYGTVRIKLYQTEICHEGGSICGTGATTDVVDGITGWIALGTLASGTLLGLFLMYCDNRRMMGHEGRWWRIGVGGALGLAALAGTVTCLWTFAPDGIHYVIEEQPSRWNTFHRVLHEGYTETPTLAAGGFVALAGVLLALAMVWRTRPVREVDAAADAGDPVVATEVEPAPRRAPIEAPPRGVETDPFRAPPAPAPLAVITPVRETSAPRADRDDAPPPALLR